MDFANVFKEVADFFMVLCAIRISFGGYEFTVGAVFLFCALVPFLIGFVRGLAS